MKKYPEYLLAVMPNEEIILLVKKWKQLLRNEIGDFGSDDSLAHITIMGFDIDVFPLQYWLNEIAVFCNNCPSRKISFGTFKPLGLSTFQVAPDQSSKKYLNSIILNIHKHFRIYVKDVNAHLTIARRLNQTEMKYAVKLFENLIADFDFICDGFVLRKFNKSIGEYSDFIAEFKFSEKQLRLL